MIKILHIGDVHLDSPFSSLEYDLRVGYKKRLFDDFCRALDFCRNESIDILLIAGDLFDTPYPDQKLVEAVTEKLSSFKGRVVISPGNHDPYFEGSVYHSSVFPENIFIFTEEKCSCIRFIIDGCPVEICGNGFNSYICNNRPDLSSVSIKKDGIVIGLFHSDIYDARSNYMPMSKEDILNLNAHYIALGHIHKRSEVLDTGDCVYCYPGCLCPRDFGETDEKGGYYLEFDSNKPSKPYIKFIPFGSIKYIVHELNTELYNNITDAVNSLPANMLDPGVNLRIKLIGASRLDVGQLTDLITSAVSDRVMQIQIIDATEEAIDYLSLENDKSVAGEFYRLLKPRLDTDPHAALALKYGLLALFDKM